MAKVFLIGAGPGDPELITVKGARLIATSPAILYTGSLVPRALLASAAPDAEVRDSAGMHLDQIVDFMQAHVEAGRDVARVHTGDPSLFGSTQEQVRRLEALDIAVEHVPGVSSFSAAAAALGRELTLPELSQTVILTRMEGRTPMPPGEKLADLARHRATLCLFLSVGLLKKLLPELIPSYGEDGPIAVVQRASWPEQRIVTGTLSDIQPKVKAAGMKATCMIIVGRVLAAEDFADSRLYAADFSHQFRKAARDDA